MPVMSLESPRVTEGNVTPSGPAGSKVVVSSCAFILKNKTGVETLFFIVA